MKRVINSMTKKDVFRDSTRKVIVKDIYNKANDLVDLIDRLSDEDYQELELKGLYNEALDAIQTLYKYR